MLSSVSRIQECRERLGLAFHEQPYILHHTISDICHSASLAYEGGIMFMSGLSCICSCDGACVT